VATRTRSGGPDTSSGAPTKSDVRHLRAQAATHDTEYRRGYEDGKAGRSEEAPFDDPSAAAVYEQGYAAGADDQQAEPEPEPEPKSGVGPAVGAGSGSRPKPSTSRIDVTGEGAGLILGVVGYALVLNYLAHGWPGVTGWISAKFLNKVTLNQAPSGVAPGAGQPGRNLPNAEGQGPTVQTPSGPVSAGGGSPTGPIFSDPGITTGPFGPFGNKPL
jgi:hypothetical protein